MQKIILYTLVIVFGFITKSIAQEDRKAAIEQRKEKIKDRKEALKNKTMTFEKKVEQISTGMEFTLAREKNELKMNLATIFNSLSMSIDTSIVANPGLALRIRNNLISGISLD